MKPCIPFDRKDCCPKDLFSSCEPAIRTVREEILVLLAGGWCSLLDISKSVGIPEKDAQEHLEHLRRSLRGKGGLIVSPPECLSCGFVFEKRDRIGRPGKCPRCRGTHISSPRFRVDSRSIPGGLHEKT